MAKLKRELYRIIPLEGLLSLIINRQERYVNPIDCWEDTYEGYMIHRLDSRDGTYELIKYLFDLFDHNPLITINNLAKLQRARFSCYGQSWSVLEDSDALWRMYSYGKRSIQISSDQETIETMIKQNKIGGLLVRVQKMHYDLDPEKPTNIVYNGSKADEAYFHKRKEFIHEEEVRVILQLTKDYSHYTTFTDNAMRVNYNKNDEITDPPKKILKSVEQIMGASFHGIYDNAFPSSFFVDINNLRDYIHSVRVHPQAERWYVDLIGSLCKEYGLDFAGQSKLYNHVV